MKTFEVSVYSQGNKMRQTIIEAINIDAALSQAKATLEERTDSGDVNWSLSPIFEGEKRVTSDFKAYGKKYQVEVFNTAFKR